MSDGHVCVLDESGRSGMEVQAHAQFKDFGGIWSVCGINGDQFLGLGTLTGLHIVKLEGN